MPPEWSVGSVAHDIERSVAVLLRHGADLVRERCLQRGGVFDLLAIAAGRSTDAPERR